MTKKSGEYLVYKDLVPGTREFEDRVLASRNRGTEALEEMLRIVNIIKNAAISNTVPDLDILVVADQIPTTDPRSKTASIIYKALTQEDVNTSELVQAPLPTPYSNPRFYFAYQSIIHPTIKVLTENGISGNTYRIVGGNAFKRYKKIKSR